MAYPTAGLRPQQEPASALQVRQPIRCIVYRCRSRQHPSQKNRIGQKRNRNNPFPFSCETVQLKKLDKRPSDIRAHHRRRKELALERRLLICAAIPEFKKNRIELAAIHAGRVPTRIEISRPRLSRHVTPIKEHGRAPASRRRPKASTSPPNSSPRQGFVAKADSTSLRQA